MQRSKPAAGDFCLTAAPVSTQEGGDVMARYATRHPAAACRLYKLMGFAVDGSTQDCR